jgi:hypothetical protein
MTNSNVSTAENLTWIYGSLLFFLGVALSIINPHYFETTFTLEDGLLEWLTVLALGTVAAVTLQRLYKNWREYTGLQNAMIAFTALLFIFGTGEEISWGQRLIGIDSPEFFLENNAQGETNLHNMIVGNTKINKLVFGKLLALGFLIYLALLTPLYRRGGTVKTWIDRFSIPIPTRRQWWGFVAVVIFVEGIIQLLSDTTKRGELTEFGASLVIMLTVLYPANRTVFDPRG